MASTISQQSHHAAAHHSTTADILPEAKDIASADRLLIVAAAGLSIHDTLPNNPYHNPADFALHYPQLRKYGYRTCYDAMGLGRDERVPDGVKRAHTAKHFLNMRFNFPPTPAYSWLLELASTFNKEDTFCWTSNVDGCFERSGFDRERVYTSQGEMNKYQCLDSRGCGHVWNCEQEMRRVKAASPDDILDDLSLATYTTCPKCGGATFPSLRGSDKFNHSPYLETQQRLLEWLDDCVARKLSVAVIEVGVGPNTPIVTSIPATAFASAVAAAGGRSTYVRVNPDARMDRVQGNTPSDLVTFYRYKDTWACLEPLVQNVLALRGHRTPPLAGRGDNMVATRSDTHSEAQPSQWQAMYTDLLMNLRTPL